MMSTGVDAAELLITLYQQLRDWERAIEVAQRCSKNWVREC